MIWNSQTITYMSGPELVQRPREGDRLANVRDAANPGHGPLDAQAEARVHERAVLAKIEIPPVGLLGQFLLTDAVQQLVVIVFPLAAADDLAVSFGRQHVVVQ